jgi:hypothetical protein
MEVYAKGAARAATSAKGPIKQYEGGSAISAAKG